MNAGLSEALEAFDRDTLTERVEKGAEEHAAILERFPRDAWPTLPLERYALGLDGDGDVYSRWIEFGTPNLGGIKGGSSHKHLVYKHGNEPGWYHNARYTDQHEAWEAVRSGFVELLALGAEGRFDEMDDIEPLLGGAAVRTKTAWVYFSDQLLPIYSDGHLDYWLTIFRVGAPKDVGRIGKNRRLFTALTNLEEFKGWSPLEIMFFLYDWSQPVTDQLILKVAPGEHGSLWDDCLKNRYIRIGWDDLGDLTQYEDADSLRAAIQQHHADYNKSVVTKTTRSLRQFAGLQTGDIVVANNGLKQVLGIGKIIGGYVYRHDLPDHRHTVEVDWFDTVVRNVSFGSAWRPTIVKLKPEQYHEIVHGVGDRLPPPIPDRHRIAESLLNRHGQLVFYGPPGTGKTYTARRHAVWLLAGGSKERDASHAFGSRFQELEAQFSSATATDERPSWLVVANPDRWRWQQLLDEGEVDYAFGRIERNYREILPGDEVFGYEASPTKRIVACARIAQGLVGSPNGAGMVIDQGVPVSNGATWEVLHDDPLLSVSEPIIQRMQGTLFRLEPAEAARIRELSGLDSGATPRSEVPQLTRVTFHPTYSYEDFIEGYKPTEAGRGGLELQMRDGAFKRVCRAAAGDPDRPYVILIDELNRGNVPKIFGELITLIEKDKRNLTVSLPQSGAAFRVPPNVHIIATMNTADRSIHVLDTALRRRFAFLELLPDPGVLEGATVGPLSLDELLTALNERIRTSIGREKQVGHAVFMNGDGPIVGLDDFALAFRYELLPSLQEYTYGDYSELANLVGDSIIDVDAQVPNESVLGDPEALVTALAAHFDLS